MLTDAQGCIALNLIPGIGHARYRLLSEYFGSPGAVFECRNPSEFERLRGIGPQLAKLLAEFPTETLLDETAFAADAGVKIITLADPEYPELLRELNDPPLCLYVRGMLPHFDCNSVAVVGSRRMSDYARRMTEQITAQAVNAGFIIVSGLAYGVDAVAHRTTVELQGCTVAVLGGGLGRIHPQDHVPLSRDIIATGGALISEFPMRFPVSRQSFPRRNRIIAALSIGTLVMEAGIDSGAMLTANMAVEQGKEVFALPGQADNPQARGCHKLIKEGAKLLENFQDVLEEFSLSSSFQPELALEIEEPALLAANFKQKFSQDEQTILNLLSEGQRPFDELVLSGGLDSGKVAAILLKFEMRNIVVQLPNKIYSLR